MDPDLSLGRNRQSTAVMVDNPEYSVSSPSSSSSSSSSSSASLNTMDNFRIIRLGSEHEGPGSSSGDSSDGQFQSTGDSSSKQVPCNQLIGVPGYDPNRISSSIFSSKPSNPLDWSVTSNESLFSIHAETSNWELQKPHDQLIPPSVNSFPMATESNQLKRQESDSSAEIEEILEKLDQKSRGRDSSSDDDEPEMIDVTEKIENPSEHNVGNDTNNIVIVAGNELQEAVGFRRSCHSDTTSNNSARSFAFPVLVAEDATKGFGDAKTAEKKPPESLSLVQQQQPPHPEPQIRRTETPSEHKQTTEKAFGKSWFSCFNCCPLRCF